MRTRTPPSPDRRGRRAYLLLAAALSVGACTERAREDRSAADAASAAATSSAGRAETAAAAANSSAARAEAAASAALEAATQAGVSAGLAGAAADASVGRSAPLTVTDAAYGARCDGVTDDTPAFAAAVTAAGGRDVYVPGGTCVLDALAISGEASLVLASAATLRHRGGSRNHMILFTGTALRIRGGRVDGNRLGQGAARRYALRAEIPTGVRVELDGVEFTGTAAAAVFVRNFGGTLEVQRCRFSDMAEHDGVPGNWTAAVYVENGQPGAHGSLRFNHNTLVGTNTPKNVGGAPGGLFFAPTLDYVGGVGNFSTLEAIGNHFWGIGQNCAGNDIAPIHTYPSTTGARVIGNYFEQSGFSAIAAKSVQNFVCQGNVIVNGQVSAANIAGEAAISYTPGYHSGSASRPRAVITGNVVDTPGGQPGVKQDGIGVLGTPTSYAAEVVVANNVLSGCGNGIGVRFARDVSLLGNEITGGTGGKFGSEYGIRLDQVTGSVRMAHNRVTVPNGHGIFALYGVGTARFVIDGNVIDTDADGTYGIVLRGGALVKLSGNVIDSVWRSVSIASDGTTPIGHLAWDLSNEIISGAVTIAFSQITRATGHLRAADLPEGLVTAPPGTLYTRAAGDASTLYVKESGAGATGWVAR